MTVSHKIKSKSHRTPREITLAILRALSKKGCLTVSRLIYNANLNSATLKKYLQPLLRDLFVSRSGTVYTITLLGFREIRKMEGEKHV